MAGAVAGTAATGWRIGDHGGSTRFVLDLAGPVTYTVAPQGNPDRLRIDLPDVDWKFGHDGSGARPDGLVRAAEFADPQGGASHIILWLSGPARVTATHLVPPSEGYRYRLVIDLQSAPGGTTTVAATPAPPAPSPPPPPPPAPRPAPPPPVAAPQAAVPAQPPLRAAPRQASVAPSQPPVVASLPPPAAPPPPVIRPAPEPAAPAGPPPAIRPNFGEPAPEQTLERSQQLAALNPPGRSSDEAPVPSRAPQPQITTTPLPRPPGEPAAEPSASPGAQPQAQAKPPQPGRPATPGATPPAAGETATSETPPDTVPSPTDLPPPRYVREPGHPVMVILAIPPPPPKPEPVDSRPIIVIDPGHGGVDPGATGLSGVREKTVTLAMALELQRQLEANGQYRVFLTRSDDNAVPLRERVRIARADHADLFLSIHADVLANRAIAGLSVYTQSETASDREADALAAKENKADLITGLDLSGEKPEITNILIDLAQRETRNRSGVFAGELVQELGAVTQLLVNPHRAAGFAVLTAPDVPSVLIELGYLSNRDDERGLTSADHRAQLAAGLVRAIDRFFAAGALLQHS